MESKIKRLQTELDQLVMEIGRVRAGGEGDLVALRERRRDLEIEIDELQAESSYIEKEALENEKRARQAEIEKTLERYTNAETSFLEAFRPVQECLQKLNDVEHKLGTAVDSFLSGGNPLQILKPIWKELPMDKQSELQRRIWDVYNITPPVISTEKTCERVRDRLNLLARSAGQLKPAKPPAATGPKRSGLRVTKTAPPPRRTASGKPEHRHVPRPKFDKNRSKGKQLLGVL